jgi:hypothetical protein
MITAQLASIPEREASLKLTVDSLRPQVDKLLVALNGYDCIPSFLNNGEFVCLDNSRGDAAKFFDVEYLSGYIFTCDDDIVYPPDYTSFMIRKIKEYRSIITLHGREYPRPFVSFRTGASYHCLCDLKRDTLLDLGGTGVMAWHSDILKVRYSDFPTPNMADVWMAKLAHEQGVSIVCAAHPAGYIQFTPCENTIWKQEKANNFKRQDKILRGFIK